MDGNRLFLLLSFFAFLVWFEVIYGIFFRDDVKKRRLTKNEQLKYAKIDKTRDVKKSLLRVDFNKTGLDGHRMSKQALKIKMTPIINKINNTTKDVPILNNTQKVLIPAQCWNIGDKKCYVRAGFPITGNKKCIYVDPGDVHNLVIGTTGSGKTWTFVNEYLELCAIMFKECLRKNIVPFVILDQHQAYYLRGLREYDRDKNFLINTCLNEQDIYKDLCKQLLNINFENGKTR